MLSDVDPMVLRKAGHVVALAAWSYEQGLTDGSHHPRKTR